MFPVVLDVTKLRIAVVGNGGRAARRAQQLREAGAAHLAEFPAVPEAGDMADVRVVFAADLPDENARRLAEDCRARGILLNVEDRPDLCSFHVPAMVRRGDLLLSVSTGGKSPGAASAVREWLEAAFGPDWAQHLEALAAARADWRADGLSMPEVAARTRAMIDESGWLPLTPALSHKEREDAAPLEGGTHGMAKAG